MLGPKPHDSKGEVLKMPANHPSLPLLTGLSERIRAAALNRTGRPFVTLTFAQSLDGSIAAKKGEPLRLSGKQSMEMTHASLDVSGVGTVLADNPQLNTREIQGPHPHPVVIDSNLRCPPDCKLIKSGRKPIIACTAEGLEEEDSSGGAAAGAGGESGSPMEAALKAASPNGKVLRGPPSDKKWRADALRRAGAEVLACRSDAQGRVDLEDCFRKLWPQYPSVMVEGGASVISALLGSLPPPRDPSKPQPPKPAQQQPQQPQQQQQEQAAAKPDSGSASSEAATATPAAATSPRPSATESLLQTAAARKSKGTAASGGASATTEAAPAQAETKAAAPPTAAAGSGAGQAPAGSGTGLAEAGKQASASAPAPAEAEPAALFDCMVVTISPMLVGGYRPEVSFAPPFRLFSPMTVALGEDVVLGGLVADPGDQRSARDQCSDCTVA